MHKTSPQTKGPALNLLFRQYLVTRQNMSQQSSSGQGPRVPGGPHHSRYRPRAATGQPPYTRGGPPQPNLQPQPEQAVWLQQHEWDQRHQQQGLQPSQHRGPHYPQHSHPQASQQQQHPQHRPEHQHPQRQPSSQPWQQYMHQQARQSYQSLSRDHGYPQHQQSTPLPVSSTQHRHRPHNIKRHYGSATSRLWDREFQDSEATFTVMSYNLLAKSLARANPHLYPDCEPKALEWRHRSQRLLAELEALGSHTYDFYCLQEVDSDDFEQLFSPKFTQWGYVGFYKKRNGDKQDGCALFYRQQRVKALSLHAVNYNENRFIDRDNVGIVGLFEIQQGNKTRRICIATTHILFSPARGMIKIAQLRMLLENAKQLIDKEDASTPIILCGDMNSLPQSTVLKYLTTENVNVSIMPETFFSGQAKGFPRRGYWENKIGAFHEAFHDSDPSMISASKTTIVKSIISMETPRSDGISDSADSVRSVEALSIVETINAIQPVEGSSVGSTISQPFLLKSAYDISAPSHDSRGNNRARIGQPFTSFHAHCKQICDYIFYGHLRSAAHYSSSPKLELVACLELPCKDIEREVGLPTPIFGSDHLSLVSKFRFV